MKKLKDNPVRKTTLEVVKRAGSVGINQKRIIEIAKKWTKENIKVPPRKEQDILNVKDEKRILDYLIILDTTNFCFWPFFAKDTEWQAASTKKEKRRVQKEKWNVEYRGKQYDGYYALSVAWKNFFENNPEKADLNYLSKISLNDFREILNGKGELQFFKKRWQMTRAVSGVLVNKYGGDSRKFIKSGKYKFSILVPKIYKELPSFRDVSVYNRKKVYLLKRAQILACDICFAFNNKGIGYFEDLDYLTAMADYRLPQILRHWGILEYSKKLADKIEKKILISSGSKEEVEIRSATVWAVECLKEELEKLGKKFHAYEIDWILWDATQNIKFSEPYHLTKSIFY